MRTVDPELWYKMLTKPPIAVTSSKNFGQKRMNTLEICLRKSFVDTITELWNNCSVPGFKYIHKMNVGRFARRLHITTILLILSVGIVLISYHMGSFLTTPPIIVSLQSTDNAIHEMHFPAIALCSNNIISKESLKNYTQFLAKKTNNIYNESYIESQLVAYGALLTIRPPPFDPSFIRFLTDGVEEEFNVTDLLFRFSTPCSSLLRRCSWRGYVVPCNSLFAARVTPLGFCCVFNSRYQLKPLLQPEDVNAPPYVLDMVGQDFGLGVVVKEDQEDSAHMRRAIYGMEMLIFDGSQYPLLEDGSLHMYPMPRNSSLYFNMLTRVQQVNRDALRYSETRRGCRERSPNWKGFSWCLTECRRNTMAALCGCTSFTLVSPSMTSEHPTCGLSELSCLHKHKEKFIYLYPWDSLESELSEELQDGLDCPECMFDCERLVYSAKISYSDYVSKKDILQNYLSSGIQLANSTVIRVFHNTKQQQRYVVETNARSSELIARSSSIWILVTGVSGVGVLELMFHCTVRWAHHFVRRYNIANLRIRQRFI